MAYWPAGYPQNDWEHLFAMQHYGIPTRLLDWSENIFVAAHFALQDHSKKDGHDHPVIWAVDPVEWNRKVPSLAGFGDEIHVMTTTDDELEPYRPTTNRKRTRFPVAIYGAHNSERIVAQKGTFFVWGNDSASLQEFCDDSGARLLKFKLMDDHEKLSSQLAALGFAETAVFPELSALAQELKRVEGWRA